MCGYFLRMNGFFGSKKESINLLSMHSRMGLNWQGYFGFIRERQALGRSATGKMPICRVRQDARLPVEWAYCTVARAYREVENADCAIENADRAIARAYWSIARAYWSIARPYRSIARPYQSIARPYQLIARAYRAIARIYRAVASEVTTWIGLSNLSPIPTIQRTR
jgi:hypothetical protein